MKDLIKQFKKLSIYKKVSFLAVLFLLVFLPIATIIALQPKDIDSKASEPNPSPTPTKIMIQVTGFPGGGRAGTTTPCGGLNQRCCGSIPSCQPITGQEIKCYAGYCRLANSITITPRARPSGPMPSGEDTQEVGVGYYKPTSTPTPTPSSSPTPTPVSSVWVP